MIGVVTKDSILANPIHNRFGKTSALGNKSPKMTNTEPIPRKPVAAVFQ